MGHRREACGGSRRVIVPFVIFCIVLDAFGQAWVEWKRWLWGRLFMAVKEKIALTVQGSIRKRAS